MEKYTIIIADDHQLFRDGIRELIAKNEAYSVLAEADNGQQLLKLLEEAQPDLILLDKGMPVMDGLETCVKVKKLYPQIRILMLTMYNDHATISKLMEAGADGYMLKEGSKFELLDAIAAIQATGHYYSQEVTKVVMQGFQAKKPEPEDEVPHSLTEREQEVLNLIVQEFTAKEIADKLFISINTVISHRRNLLRKFDVRNTAGIVRYAMEHGLVQGLDNG